MVYFSIKISHRKGRGWESVLRVRKGTRGRGRRGERGSKSGCRRALCYPCSWHTHRHVTHYCHTSRKRVRMQKLSVEVRVMCKTPCLHTLEISDPEYPSVWRAKKSNNSRLLSHTDHVSCMSTLTHRHTRHHFSIKCMHCLQTHTNHREAHIHRTNTHPKALSSWASLRITSKICSLSFSVGSLNSIWSSNLRKTAGSRSSGRFVHPSTVTWE